MFSEEFKRDLDKVLSEVREYILSTYGEHYVGSEEEENVQVIDLMASLGSLDTTARDMSIKYLARYGKKDGKNRKDLLKPLHYTMMILYFDHLRKKRSKGT